MSAEIQLEHRGPVRRLLRRVMSALDRGLDWCEVHGSWATDGLNPILVKETRQALKSRQFVVSFLVVLGACWIATIGGVAVIGPEIYWGAAGREMLVAYFCILAAPLVIVVPYSAYRSLAVEREENTYDLLSITTLGARQIVTGKLLSAAAQMLVYFSAGAPCIAFTFLLRGVDAITVGMLLGLLVFVCLGLSMIALVTGTLSQAKYSQVVVSVGLVLGLVAVFSGVVALAYAMIESGAQLYGEEEVWLTLLLVASYVVIFGLLHAAAEAQLMTIALEARNCSRVRMASSPGAGVPGPGVLGLAISSRSLPTERRRSGGWPARLAPGRTGRGCRGAAGRVGGRPADG